MKKIKKFPVVLKKSTKILPNPTPPEKVPTPKIVRKFSPKPKPAPYDLRKKVYTDNRKDEDSQTEDIFFKM